MGRAAGGVVSREVTHDPLTSTIATLLEHSCRVIDRKNEVIAMNVARLDQVEAANEALHSQNARLTRENTTLRSELREARR